MDPKGLPYLYFLGVIMTTSKKKEKHLWRPTQNQQQQQQQQKKKIRWFFIESDGTSHGSQDFSRQIWALSFNLFQQVHPAALATSNLNASTESPNAQRPRLDQRLLGAMLVFGGVNCFCKIFEGEFPEHSLVSPHFRRLKKMNQDKICVYFMWFCAQKGMSHVSPFVPLRQTV